MYNLPWLYPLLILLGVGLPLANLVLRYRRWRLEGHQERHMLPKLLGIYALCAFSFTLQGVMLPLGFFVYFIMVAPRGQIKQAIKRTAVVMGLVTFGVQLVYHTLSESRTVWETEMIHIGTSAYQVPWGQLDTRVRELAGKDVRVEEMGMRYDPQGQIEELKLTLQDSSRSFYMFRWAPQSSELKLEYNRVVFKQEQGPGKRAPESFDAREEKMQASELFGLLEELQPQLSSLQPQGSFAGYSLYTLPQLYGSFTVGQEQSYLLRRGEARQALLRGERREAARPHINLYISGLTRQPPVLGSNGQGHTVTSGPTAQVRYYVELERPQQ